MKRFVLLSLALVVAVAGVPAFANAAAGSDAIQAAAPSTADTLGPPPRGFIYAWAYTSHALRHVVANARARGYITAGVAQYGYVREAGGHAWWIRII